MHEMYEAPHNIFHWIMPDSAILDLAPCGFNSGLISKADLYFPDTGLNIVYYSANELTRALINRYSLKK
jgi:hypothetical protein